MAFIKMNKKLRSKPPRPTVRCPECRRNIPVPDSAMQWALEHYKEKRDAGMLNQALGSPDNKNASNPY